MADKHQNIQSSEDNGQPTINALWSDRDGNGQHHALNVKVINPSGGGSGGGPATIADGADMAQGSTSDAIYTTGSGTIVGILKGIFGKLAGTITTNATVQNFPTSQAVTGAVSVSNLPTTQTVSATSLPLPTGAAQDSTITTNFGIKADTTWDGSSSASGISLFRYIGIKIEAVRALLAGSLHTTVDNTSLVTTSVVNGATTDTAYSDTTGATSGTSNSLLKGIFTKLANVLTVGLQGDCGATSIWSVDVQLSSTANTASSFAIPSSPRAKGFRVLSSTSVIRYSIDSAPPSSRSTSSATSNTGTSYLGQYNSVVAGVPEVRLFNAGSTPTNIQFSSTSANATFILEFF